jgi:hypothetical protein
MAKRAKEAMSLHKFEAVSHVDTRLTAANTGGMTLTAARRSKESQCYRFEADRH